MLLHLCFKCISGNINFDLYYTSCKCIFRIYIYISIRLSVQLISDDMEDHFDCLRMYIIRKLYKI